MVLELISNTKTKIEIFPNWHTIPTSQTQKIQIASILWLSSSWIPSLLLFCGQHHEINAKFGIDDTGVGDCHFTTFTNDRGSKAEVLKHRFPEMFPNLPNLDTHGFFSTNNLQQEGTPLSQLQSSENPTQREENFLMMMKVGMMMNTVMKVLRTTEKRKDFNPK